ncbi:hypothetical protein LBUL_1649 [Lactobacillus delbrueckii subsp. bulgaricus ATCC BAA-365]|nr:hypothetical protein LBUL_1649 [Lactobacillus delbrueckii subsp. bulgaricus ATCC BAA-365]
MTEFITFIDLFRTFFNASAKFFLIFANTMKLGIAFKLLWQVVIMYI